jgi:23S rRNA pseudouridine1911/1915/1917 synthase
MSDLLKKPSQVWTWLVPTPQERADVAVLQALEENPPECPVPSRSQLKRLIEEGRVTLNQKPMKANQKLKASDWIQIEFPPPLPSELVPEDRPLEILFEDEFLVVINKPPGLTVHPSTTQMEGTLVHVLLHHIKDLSGIGGVLRPGIVHRIDKNTSGALVITKTDPAHQRLSEVFAKHEIERSYWALCYGSPSFKTTRVESLIGRSPTDRKKMSMTVKEGKRAVTHLKKLKEFGVPNKKPFASWIEATLETGRTHQVRVHLTGQGHSILGDPVYGEPSENHPKWVALPQEVREAVKKLPGQALHARVLGFEHPMTHQKLRFEAELPEEFKNLLRILQLHQY